MRTSNSEIIYKNLQVPSIFDKAHRNQEMKSKVQRSVKKMGLLRQF